MKKQKQIYVSPETETLVVRFEGNLMVVSGQMNANSWTSGSSNWWDDDDEE